MPVNGQAFYRDKQDAFASLTRVVCNVRNLCISVSRKYGVESGCDRTG
jgi:hypothetical protein